MVSLSNHVQQHCSPINSARRGLLPAGDGRTPCAMSIDQKAILPEDTVQKFPHKRRNIHGDQIGNRITELDRIARGPLLDIIGVAYLQLVGCRVPFCEGWLRRRFGYIPDADHRQTAHSGAKEFSGYIGGEGHEIRR